MNLEDRLYSESELRGKPSENPETEKLYSQDEVLEISDLFDEFYQLHGDTYSDVNAAYDEFMDAYANVELIEDNPKMRYQRKTAAKASISKNTTRGVAGAAGAAAGYGAAHILNKGAKAEKANIEKKMVTGRASSKDIERLEKLKKKIRSRKLAGTIVGAASGVAAVKLAGTSKSKNYSTEDFVEDTYPVMTTAALVGGAKLIGAGMAAGGTIGNIASRVRNRKTKSRIDYLKKKGNSLSWPEKRELEKLRKEYNSKLAKNTGKGAIVGGAAGLGGAAAGGVKAAAGAKALLAAKGKAVVGAAKVGAAKVASAIGAAPSAVTGTVGATAAGAAAGHALKSKETNDKIEKAKEEKVVKKTANTVAGAVVGGASGYGISHLATKKLRSAVAELEKKDKRSKSENEKLAKLKKKLITIKAGSTVGGAVAGGAIGNSIKSKK